MKFCFGDIVVVEGNLIGVIVKSWVIDNKYLQHEVYVREYSCIKQYDENDIERYMVRHKELNSEEVEYQENALNPFISEEEIEGILSSLNLANL